MDWPKINRFRTPEVLRAFFDKEYELYIKDGWSYLFSRTMKVVKFVKMTVKLHKKRIGLVVLEIKKK